MIVKRFLFLFLFLLISCSLLQVTTYSLPLDGGGVGWGFYFFLPVTSEEVIGGGSTPRVTSKNPALSSQSRISWNP